MRELERQGYVVRVPTWVERLAREVGVEPDALCWWLRLEVERRRREQPRAESGHSTHATAAVGRRLDELEVVTDADERPAVAG
jgi:hypothetical protein